MGRPVDPRSARLSVERTVEAILEKAELSPKPFGAFVTGGRLLMRAVDSRGYREAASPKKGRASRTMIGTYTLGVSAVQVREDVIALLESLPFDGRARPRRKALR